MRDVRGASLGGGLSMRRVVVTGLGVVSPNGIGKDAFWSACVEGRSGVGPIRSFDASGHPVRVAAEVPDFDLTPYVPPEYRKSLKIMGLASSFGVAAAGVAVRDSGLALDRPDPRPGCVVMGSGPGPGATTLIAPVAARALRTGGRIPSRP